MNLIEILSTKSDNAHLISRYVKYIETCNERNKKSTGYLEEHHICPKADDLFPEYIDLRSHVWNRCLLTAREHIIAHVMLSKIFGGSQIYALHYMVNVNGKRTGIIGKHIPPSTTIRYAAKAREAYNEWRLGKGVYKDQSGNRFFLDVNDPKIKELGLVGLLTGYTPSEETLAKISATRLQTKTVTLYFLDMETTVQLLSEEFDSLIAQGWNTKLTNDDVAYRRAIGSATTAEKMKGRSRYALPDGTFYAMLTYDDPIIDKLGLVHHSTDASRAQLESIRHLGAAALTGSNIYNNGKVEARFKEVPDDPQWKLGRLPRSVEHDENQRNAARDSTLDHLFYNDGKVTIKVHKDDPVPAGFVPGMVKKKVSIHDGIDSYRNNPLPRLATISNADLAAMVRQETNGTAARYKPSWLMKNIPDLVNECVMRTIGVPNEWGISERLILLEHDLTGVPKCVVCGNPVKPNTEENRIPSVCCSKCYQQTQRS